MSNSTVDSSERYAEPSSGDALRLAIISTPRSGNTWLRLMLATAYELAEVGAGRPDALDWPSLPLRCALQMHWHPDDSFVELLRLHQFRVIVLARHPLDVLISALNFNFYAHDRGSCVKGHDCPECSMLGASPRGKAFLEYACGPNGRYLLSFSPAWWNQPDVIRTRYESLVDDTRAALERLVAEIGVAPKNSLDAAIEANTLEGLRKNDPGHGYHFWQGRAGLWRSLLPPAAANPIARAIADITETLGYECEADPNLSDAGADQAWLDLLMDGARTHYGPGSVEHPAARRSLTQSRQRLATTVDSLAGALGELRAARQQLDRERSTTAPAEQSADNHAVIRTLRPKWRIHQGVVGLLRGLSRKPAGRRHKAEVSDFQSQI
jgi:hypothetical protein